MLTLSCAERNGSALLRLVVLLSRPLNRPLLPGAQTCALFALEGVRIEDRCPACDANTCPASSAIGCPACDENECPA